MLCSVRKQHIFFVQSYVQAGIKTENIIINVQLPQRILIADKLIITEVTRYRAFLSFYYSDVCCSYDETEEVYISKLHDTVT